MNNRQVKKANGLLAFSVGQRPTAGFGDRHQAIKRLYN